MLAETSMVPVKSSYEDMEEPEPEPEDRPVDEPEDDTAEQGESRGGSGVEEAGADKIVANVYQIVKAMEVGAATAVDLRQALYPDEDRATAERVVQENIEYNTSIATSLGAVKAAEAEASAPEPSTGPVPPELKLPSDEDEDEEEDDEG